MTSAISDVDGGLFRPFSLITNYEFNVKDCKSVVLFVLKEFYDVIFSSYEHIIVSFIKYQKTIQ